MKNHFLLFVLLLLPFIISAQASRRVLVEEATNASCPPCATQNPAFDALMQQNSDIVAVIKYHSSWPGYDPMYSHNTTENTARISFYGINSVPRAIVGGIFNGAPNQVTQSMLNSYAAEPSPFEEIAIYHYLSPNEDSIHTFMRIRAAQDYSLSSMRWFCVVVEKHVSFSSPPGSNGEKEFYDVMKKMLPGSGGSPLKSNWSDGEYEMIFQSWKLANVYDNEQLGIVGFIQNVNNKVAIQSGVSSDEPFAPLYDNDIAALSLEGMTTKNCTGKLSPALSFANYGGNDITSVDIYYSVNDEPPQMTTWTGELSYLNTKSILLPEISFEVQDENQLKVYFSNTNASGDEYPANDTITYNFERALEILDNVSLMIKLDSNPEETTWDIKNPAGEIVHEGGPYSEPNTLVNLTLDFDEPDCYQFTIYDAGNNGLALPGFFNLSKGSVQILGGTTFDSYASQQFSVGLSVGMPELSFDPQVIIYPNPLSNSGTISFDLSQEAVVEMTLINQLGQGIKKITSGIFASGSHQLNINSNELPQGLYFLEIRIGNDVQIKKISVLN
jgi:hypothetical protein